MKHNHTNKGKKLKIKIKTDVPEDEAKQYLKKYNLKKFFQNFVNNIMQENPENPIVYMIKYIAGEMSKEEYVFFRKSKTRLYTSAVTSETIS